MTAPDSPAPPRYTAFVGERRLAGGDLPAVAVAVKRAGAEAGPVLVFEDATGRPLDLDTRGDEAEVAARYAPAPDEPPAPARGRGRPRLGVVAREVTLLPRHWDWLNAQPGGASAALRRLVEDASRRGRDQDAGRRAREAAYAFMQAIAGDYPGFEEAIRALFANDRAGVERWTQAWPKDVRDHALRLAFPQD